MKFKALKGSAVALSLAGLTACGQGYTPSSEQHVAGPQGGGAIFGSGTDTTTYRTASYDVLVSALVDVMGVADVTTGIPTTECAAATLTAGACPKYQPLAYLAANKGALGAPVYNQADPLSTQAPGPMSSGGFKAWVLASSSAAGLMMQQAQPALFPNGIHDYKFMYEVLLGRTPTEAEIARLDQVAADIATANPGLATASLTQRQGAAIVSSVLGSLEFMMVN